MEFPMLRPVRDDGDGSGVDDDLDKFFGELSRSRRRKWTGSPGESFGSLCLVSSVTLGVGMGVVALMVVLTYEEGIHWNMTLDGGGLKSSNITRAGKIEVAATGKELNATATMEERNNEVSALDRERQWNETLRRPPERVVLNNVETLWKAPIEPAIATLFLFHGCGESAGSWWDLPEHRGLVNTALRRRINCVAFSAANMASKCWSTKANVSTNGDVFRVRIAAQEWLASRNMNDRPRIAVGVGNGATFLAIFSEFMHPKISAQALYDFSLPVKSVATGDPGSLPDTLLVDLENRESRNTKAARLKLQTLAFLGVQRLASIIIPPSPLRHDSFSSCMENLNDSQSAELLHRFQTMGMVGLDGRISMSWKRKSCHASLALLREEGTSQLAIVLQNKANRDSICEIFHSFAADRGMSSHRALSVLRWLMDDELPSLKPLKLG